MLLSQMHEHVSSQQMMGSYQEMGSEMFQVLDAQQGTKPNPRFCDVYVQCVLCCGVRPRESMEYVDKYAAYHLVQG